jgi:hypothetical protein
MKRAKIMLSVIAIVGIICGALAFKAQKFTQRTYYYCNAVPTPNTCATAVVISNRALTTVNDGTFFLVTNAGELTSAGNLLGVDCSDASPCNIKVYGVV